MDEDNVATLRRNCYLIKKHHLCCHEYRTSKVWVLLTIVSVSMNQKDGVSLALISIFIQCACAWRLTERLLPLWWTERESRTQKWHTKDFQYTHEQERPTVLMPQQRKLKSASFSMEITVCVSIPAYHSSIWRQTRPLFLIRSVKKQSLFYDSAPRPKWFYSKDLRTLLQLSQFAEMTQNTQLFCTRR